MNDIHGKVTVKFTRHGNWQDLAEILLVNGYSLKISMEEADFASCKEAEITMTIFKEEK